MEEGDKQNTLLESLMLDGWRTDNELSLKGREGESFSIQGIGLAPTSLRFVQNRYDGRVYQHQKDAVVAFKAGHDVCLATGTASGKTLAFQLCALETLSEVPGARILAVYPLKALARQQARSWQRCLDAAGVQGQVARIDGGVSSTERFKAMSKARVIIATPDIIHAWMLANIGDSRVRKGLGQIRCVVIDEAHSYTGVFGSNSAFVYRRLEHAVKVLGGNIRYVAASATIASPEEHLQSLTGHDFTVIGAERDTSPKQPVTIHFLEPPKDEPYVDALCDVLRYAGRRPERFIAFVDSRKQTSQLAIIAERTKKSESDITADDPAQVLGDISDEVGKDQILPYRSGYEDETRKAIEDRLMNSTVQGVVSTSALELGIDIGSLEVAILGGVPRSLTSLWQRIGRVGRKSPGDVYIVKNDDLLTKSVFANPQSLLSLPLSEGALYLDNERIQYIHALCLARHGGENDQALDQTDPLIEFSSPVTWPKGFVELCEAERSGAVPRELQQMKTDAGDEPNRVFPLRDVEPQFTVHGRDGMTEESLGSLTYAQVMRETYPGAVYYYVKNAYRVTKVQPSAHRVEVRREKRYYTKPQLLPIMVFPNLSEGHVLSWQCSDLRIVEAQAQVREAVSGYTEMRGSQKLAVEYPLDPAHGIFWDSPRFSRTYFTTGVFLSHPVLINMKNSLREAATFLCEVLMSIVPLDSRDVAAASGKYMNEKGPIHKGDRFLAVFDQTYGSLRLSHRLTEPMVLQQLGKRMPMLLDQYVDPATGQPLPPEACEAVTAIATDMLATPQTLSILSTPPQADCIPVIMAGSSGTSITRGCQEFTVERVFYNPHEQKLMYFGKYHESVDGELGSTETAEPIEDIKEIPGESKMGFYDAGTGEVKES